MPLHPATRQVVEVVASAAPALPDKFAMLDLYVSLYDNSNAEVVPPLWQDAIAILDRERRGMLASSLGVAITNHGLLHVGVVRRLPKRELLQARHVGPSTAAVLKALGHYADKEISFWDTRRYAAAGPPNHTDWTIDQALFGAK